jgi:hypothetical protein
MKVQNGGLLSVACGGMELSWLYAWASFIMTSVVHRPFPFPEAVGTFVLAAMLTLFSQGRGWRVIVVIALQVFGFMLAVSRIVYVFFYASHPFFAQLWLLECLRQEKNPLEWFILIIILLFTLMFWVGGMRLARRSAEYFAICNRFDLGVAAFFCLLLVKLLLLVKGEIDIRDPTPELLLFPFFLFSLLSIGMARNRSRVRKDFLSGYQGIGIALSFGVVVVAFGGGLVGLFLPYLSKAAEMGYGVLKGAAAPLSPILVAILRFIFVRNRGRPESASSLFGRDEMELVSPSEGSWWTDLLEKILGWGLLGLGVLIALILCSVSMWYIFRWLFSRSIKNEKTPIQWRLIALWAARIWASLVRCWNAIARSMRGYKSAVQLYSALLKWGGHSGVPHVPSETPTEYCMRLGRQFPFAGRDIGLITELFNKEVYGRIGIDEQQFTMAKLAWRRLYNPIHWPTRFKSWFLRSGA